MPEKQTGETKLYSTACSADGDRTTRVKGISSRVHDVHIVCTLKEK
jgi:hypothetical protein